MACITSKVSLFVFSTMKFWAVFRSTHGIAAEHPAYTTTGLANLALQPEY
jgi:hypothetical protein